MAWYSRARSSFNSATSFSLVIAPSAFVAASVRLMILLSSRVHGAKRTCRSAALRSGAARSALPGSIRSVFSNVLRLQGLHEFIRLLFSHVPGDTVALLNASNELLAAPVDYVQIVIRELSPLFLHLALILFPLSFHLIPVHGLPPWKFLLV